MAHILVLYMYITLNKMCVCAYVCLLDQAARQARRAQRHRRKQRQRQREAIERGEGVDPWIPAPAPAAMARKGTLDFIGERDLLLRVVEKASNSVGGRPGRSPACDEA